MASLKNVPRHALVIALFATSSLIAVPATATHAPDGCDLNADGYADLIISAPGETIAGQTEAGAVHVLYGSSTGVTGAGDVVLHQNKPGVDGTAETGDRFGWATACGDLNGDGYDELVVSTPFEEIGGVSEAGVAHIFWGSHSGVSSTDSMFLSQAGPAVANTVEPFDWFGAAIAIADFDRDGFDDLALGIPNEELDGKFGGAVQLFPGSESGVDLTSDKLLHEDVPGMLGEIEFDDQFGASLGTGDFDGDGYPDLAVGVPSQKVDNVRRAGAVHVIRGSSKGLTPAGDRILDRATPGMKRDPHEEDHFAAALVSGDFDGDGFDDLAIGVPWADVDDGLWIDAGEVSVVHGSVDGLDPARDQVFSQHRAGVKNEPRDFERFGSALAAADLNADGAADLAIGVPGNQHRVRRDAGAVNILFGEVDAGLVRKGDLFVSQRGDALATKPEVGDLLGRTLLAGDFNGDGAADLVIGAPAEDSAGLEDVGIAHLIPGGQAGIDVSGSIPIQQGKRGTKGVGEAFDGFGWAGASTTLTPPPP